MVNRPAPASAPDPAAAAVPSEPASMQADAFETAATPPAPAPAVTVADLPPTDDTGLPPAAWIERIRQRGDAGRPDDARASLALLRDAHPALALPDDLRALAADAPPPAP